MNLLELLHNEQVVKLLEKIDLNIKDLKEGEDFSFIFPTLIFIGEMILNKNNKSNISQIIYKKKELQELSEEKSLNEQKIIDWLEKELVKNKNLNYEKI